MANHEPPRWIRALLDAPGARALLRVTLTSAYLLGGLDKALHFDGAVAEQAHFGLHPPMVWAALAVIVEIGGSLAIIVNRFVWLGAGALGVLTVVAMLAANDFWNQTGMARFIAFNSFFEHLGLIAALAMAVILADRRETSTPFR